MLVKRIQNNLELSDSDGFPFLLHRPAIIFVHGKHSAIEVEIVTDIPELLTRIEQKRLWAYFHKDWLLQIRELLRPQLPRELAIFVESESVMISPHSGVPLAAFAADVSVARPDVAVPTASVLDQASATVLEVDEEIELYEQYSLLIRRAPENRVVAAAEILSPTNKGVFGVFDKDKYLRKREAYFDAGINLLEIDALLEGDRILPPALDQLRSFNRTAWTVCHAAGRRHYRSWGWSASEPLPKVEWEVEPGLSALVDLSLSCRRACEFNPWETLAN